MNRSVDCGVSLRALPFGGRSRVQVKGSRFLQEIHKTASDAVQPKARSTPVPPGEFNFLERGSEHNRMARGLPADIIMIRPTDSSWMTG